MMLVLATGAWDKDHSQQSHTPKLESVGQQLWGKTLSLDSSL